MTVKTCNTCKVEKPIDNFSKDKTSKDQLQRKCKECVKKYQSSNKDRIKANRVLYKEKNKEYFKQYNTTYHKKRREKDTLFKLRGNLRNRMKQTLRQEKSKSTEELLGAPLNEVKKHIESTFQEGMTWENYGQWHVDHKIPLASGKTKKEIEKLFHYKNLQALWALDNWSKGNKITD